MFQCGKTRESAYAPQSDDNYTRHHKIHCLGSPNLMHADILPNLLTLRFFCHKYLAIINCEAYYQIIYRCILSCGENMFQCGKTRESAYAPQSDDNYTRHHKIHCWGSPNLTRADILPTSHDDAKHPCGRLYGIKRISNKFRRP